MTSSTSILQSAFFEAYHDVCEQLDSFTVVEIKEFEQHNQIAIIPFGIFECIELNIWRLIKRYPKNHFWIYNPKKEMQQILESCQNEAHHSGEKLPKNVAFFGENPEVDDIPINSIDAWIVFWLDRHDVLDLGKWIFFQYIKNKKPVYVITLLNEIFRFTKDDIDHYHLHLKRLHRMANGYWEKTSLWSIKNPRQIISCAK